MRAPRQLLGTARKCLARQLEMAHVTPDTRLPGCSKAGLSCSRSRSYIPSPWKMKVAPRAESNARMSRFSPFQRLPRTIVSLSNAQTPVQYAGSPLSFKTVQHKFSRVLPQDRSVNRYRTLMTNSSMKEGRSRTLKALIRSNSGKAVQRPTRTLSKLTSDTSSLLHGIKEGIKYGSTENSYLRSPGTRGMGIIAKPGERAAEHGQRLPLARPDSSPEAIKARERDEFLRSKREQLAAEIDEVEGPFRDATETGKSIGESTSDMIMNQPSTQYTRTADAPASTTATEPGEELASEVHEAKQKEGTGAMLDDTELVAAGTEKAHQMAEKAERESRVEEQKGAEPEPWVKLENVVFPPRLLESTDEALQRGLKLYEIRREGWEEPEDIIISALRRAKLV